MLTTHVNYQMTTAQPGPILSVKMIPAEFVSSLLEKRLFPNNYSSVQSFTHTVLYRQPNVHPKAILILLNTFWQGKMELYMILGKYYSFILLIESIKWTRQKNPKTGNGVRCVYHPVVPQICPAAVETVVAEEPKAIF